MGWTILSVMFGCILSSFVISVHSKCTISSNWAPASRDVRLLMASAVVYGKTTEHKASRIQVDGEPFYVIDAVFEVYCILKQGPDPISEKITIKRISPRDGCSGTLQNMKTGEEAIVAIKSTDQGDFEYDEVMPTLSATFPATKTNIISVSSACYLQAWSPPVDARTNRCPICGVSNFTDDVMATAIGSNLPCVFDGTQFSNVSNCDSFTTIDIDISASCMPINYNQTCTKIMYNPTPVTCFCDGKLPKMNGNMFQETGTGYTALPGIMMTVLSLCASVFILT